MKNTSKTNLLVNNLRMIADAIERGYPLDEDEQKMIEQLANDDTISDSSISKNDKSNTIDWKELIKVQPTDRKRVEKLTSTEYDEIATKADEKIRKGSIVSPSNQKILKLDRFSKSNEER